MKVGYQGNHGTFSEIAALRYFAGKNPENKGYKNFRAIMKDVESGELDYAVVPVENTTTGIIARCYDLFQHYNIHAVGEINVPIHEDLIVVPGTKIEEIKEVYSHPEALSQCTNFFAEHENIKQVPFQDTAKSVEYIKECNDHAKAALGSYRAREYYQMESLLEQVQDSNLNMTRFLVITAKEEQDPAADKISTMMVLKHRPGALYNTLGILSKNGINIVKLESRPIPGRVFEYLFYIDFYGNTKDREMKQILHELDLHCVEMKILGCYKEAERYNGKDNY
ncbi:MAG: prephenate dehydratase [Solobacterium sp.]|nr:prephenate dehydratase [Solobacterium sp.]